MAIRPVAVRGAIVTASVPEPTTMLLFGIGVLGMAGVSRKKKIAQIFKSTLKVGLLI